MKKAYFYIPVAVLFFAFVLTPRTTVYETESINGICFYGLDTKGVNLTDEFKQALYSGRKTRILDEIQGLNDDHCSNGCLREWVNKHGSRICDVSGESLTVYTLNMKNINPAYMFVHLKMYFDGDKMKAAIVSAVIQK